MLGGKKARAMESSCQPLSRLFLRGRRGMRRGRRRRRREEEEEEGGGGGGGGRRG